MQQQTTVNNIGLVHSTYGNDPSLLYNAQGDRVVENVYDKTYPVPYSYSAESQLTNPVFNSTEFNQPIPTYDNNIQVLSQGVAVAPLTKQEKKALKREQKHERTMQKLEMKRQSVENKMINRQPANMAIVQLPLVANEALVTLTTYQKLPGYGRMRIEGRWNRMFDGLPEEEINTVKGKGIRWAHRKFEGLGPDTRLLNNAPKTINQITLIHPSLRSDVQSYDALVDFMLLGKHKHKKGAAITGVALPLIAGAEFAAPVWPLVVTWVDLAFFAFYLNAYRGSKRIGRFLANQLGNRELATAVPSPIIDKWMNILQTSGRDVLDENQIVQMCAEIGVPQVTGDMLELRRRYLRNTGQHMLLPPKEM